MKYLEGMWSTCTYIHLGKLIDMTDKGTFMLLKTD